MKVKVCGITNIDDALLAESLGADYIGLIFSPLSKRQVSIAVAKEISAALAHAIPVGVFVEESDDEIIAHIRQCLLGAVQVYRHIDSPFAEVETIEAIRVKDIISAEVLASSAAGLLLLDVDHGDTYGGTGETFNWDLLPSDVSRLFLAGGLTVENVAKAAAYQPYALDVCSGVEISPGVKDPIKLAKFFAELQTC